MKKWEELTELEKDLVIDLMGKIGDIFMEIYRESFEKLWDALKPILSLVKFIPGSVCPYCKGTYLIGMAVDKLLYCPDCRKNIPKQIGG